jgi:hypothetical protein
VARPCDLIEFCYEPNQHRKKLAMTSHYEIDARIKDIIEEAHYLFPDADFSEGIHFYDHGEWELALDSVFFTLKAVNKDVPIDLYEKIVSAAERMKLFPISHWDAIKPKKE